jgi:hypothetical protein
MWGLGSGADDRSVMQAERVLKALYLKKMYLWPRFHVSVATWLSQREPDVIELAQSLTPGKPKAHSNLGRSHDLRDGRQSMPTRGRGVW